MANVEPRLTKSSSSPRFKSQHLNTIRSMHMIQELQSYIESLETLAQQQKEQIQRVSEQNKVYVKQMKNPAARPKLGEEFGGEGKDLPPRLRAIIEDNRVLKDRAKKYKEEVSQSKKTISTQEQDILKLQDKVSSLSEKVATLSRSQGDAMTQEKLQEKVAEQERSITNLEHKVAVITKSKETESKKLRNNLAASTKKVKGKESEIDQLKSDIQSKDKELRAKVIECKALQKKLEQPKRHTVRKDEMASKEQVKSTSGKGATPSQAPSNGPIQIVINLVVGPEGSQSNSTGKVAKEISDESAATAIQSRYRGFKARQKTSQQMKDRKQAAIKIQSVQRGRQARRESGIMKQEQMEKAVNREKEEVAAVKIQAHARGLNARKQVKKMKEEKNNEANAKDDGSPEKVVTTAMTSSKESQPSKGAKPKQAAK